MNQKEYGGYKSYGQRAGVTYTVQVPFKIPITYAIRFGHKVWLYFQTPLNDRNSSVLSGWG